MILRKSVDGQNLKELLGPKVLAGVELHSSGEVLSMAATSTQ
jgi:hypothetical protein